ncbi:MAG TPA: helix-turn-helix domain-containing protein [Micromonosporaceae bacterium]
METHGLGPAGESVDTARHRALASTTRVVILLLVRQAPRGLTAAEVAQATGRHLTTVREHLEQLTSAGLLIRQRDHGGTPGRPAWRYRPAAGQVETPSGGPYRELAAALVEHIVSTESDPWAAGVSAGRAWGRRLVADVQPVTARPGQRLLAVLERLGFAPRVAVANQDEPEVVHLHACPFLDLVGSSADLVCGMHLGVLRGALEAAGAPGVRPALEPFGAPGACVVRMRPAETREAP